jgi:hypothetical protein
LIVKIFYSRFDGKGLFYFRNEFTIRIEYNDSFYGIFEGDWTGKEIDLEINPFTSGYVFDGAFSNGVPSGLGKFSLKNETKNLTLEYEGGWFEGKRNGYGTNTWLTGDKYVGYRKLKNSFISLHYKI